MSTTGQDSQTPLVNIATVAEWRRRQEASSEILPLADDGEKHADGSPVSSDADAIDTADERKRANGFQAKNHVAINGSADSVVHGFADAQQAGLSAMISLARSEAPSQSRPGARTSASPGPPVRPVMVPPSQSPTTGASASRKRRADGNKDVFARMSALPIASILVVQAILSLRLIWSNTAFGDEALYLWAGHLEWAHWLHGTPVPGFPSYFSGAPVVYPPLGALADSIGGLAGARILSLGFMLGATALLNATAARLFNRKIALFACALFVAVGPTADVGAFATYDAMAIFLLALATWMAIRAQRRTSELWLIGSALVVVLADATKYASVLWNPAIVALAVLAAPINWKRSVARGVRFISYVVATLTPLLFLLGGRRYINGLMFTTLDRKAADTHVSALTVLHLSAVWIGPIVILAVGGAAASRKTLGLRKRLLCWVLAVTLLLAPLHQAQILTVTSLYKHVVFGAWFGVIAGGYLLAQVARINEEKAWRVGAAVVLAVGVIGFGQATALFGFWPNSNRLVAAVAGAIPANSGPILAPNGDANVINYYLRARLTDHGVLSPNGTPMGEITVMIEDGDFSLVAINEPCDADTSSDSCAIQSALQATPGYQIASRVPWSDHYGHGIFEIWQKGTR